MSYAQLGNSCQTSMDTLLDNRKFFPLEDPVYKIFLTKMQRYPGISTELDPISYDVERPEEIKTSRKKTQLPENFCTSCQKF